MIISNCTIELPKQCFAVDPEKGDLIRIIKGVHGRFTMNVQFKTKELNQRKADKLNADMGVTQRQVAAMEYGSLYGWNTPEASPTAYTTSGRKFCRI